MPRGGKRQGAGSKPKWKHGKTKVIRVPESLADDILRIAHQLDQKHEPIVNYHSKALNLSGCSIFDLRGRKAVFLDDLLKLGYEIYPLKLAQAIRQQLIKI